MKTAQLQITEEYLLGQGLSKTFPERFWSKVDKRGEDECWIWKASKNSNGYGQIASGIGHYTPPVIASRAAWVLTRGPIPEGLDILHKCPGRHNRACVNPNHLQPGTPSENGNDCVKQGNCWFKKHATEFRGEKSPTHKLSQKQINEIRQKYTGKRGEQSQLAREYGVRQGNIWYIVNHKTWV